jgi:hypothetical protein
MWRKRLKVQSVTRRVIEYNMSIERRRQRGEENLMFDVFQPRYVTDMYQSLYVMKSIEEESK